MSSFNRKINKNKKHIMRNINIFHEGEYVDKKTFEYGLNLMGTTIVEIIRQSTSFLEEKYLIENYELIVDTIIKEINSQENISLPFEFKNEMYVCTLIELKKNGILIEEEKPYLNSEVVVNVGKLENEEILNDIRKVG